MYVMVDVETDGPIPGDYSMVALGAVIVEPRLDRTYRAIIRPISEKWQPEALAISGLTRAECLNGFEPVVAMLNFEEWLRANIPAKKRPVFISDNNGFDWSFVNWYFHKFLGHNPFGFSSQNLNSMYKGLRRDYYASFKHLRKTPHTHDPVMDAKGNAEALLAILEEFKTNK